MKALSKDQGFVLSSEQASALLAARTRDSAHPFYRQRGTLGFNAAAEDLVRSFGYDPAGSMFEVVWQEGSPPVLRAQK